MRWGQKAKDATEYSNFPKKEVRNVGCGFLIWYILYQFGWVYSKCMGKFVQCGCGYFVVGVSPNRLYRFIGHIRFP
jgi:hypothetical protein